MRDGSNHLSFFHFYSTILNFSINIKEAIVLDMYFNPVRVLLFNKEMLIIVCVLKRFLIKNIY